VASLSICRIGDMATGWCSICNRTVTGRIITGSPNVYVQGKPVARKGDLVMPGCGHGAGRIVRVSPNIRANGLGVARVNDTFHGTYTGRLLGGAALTRA
jgi:uncharacterized Zn-binding protein involved in type VI secretion